jgi:hypothetical protein
VVFDSEQDGTSTDFEEPRIPAGKQGQLMQPTVGPFRRALTGSPSH